MYMKGLLTVTRERTYDVPVAGDSFCALKGYCPVSMVNRSTPKDHISALCNDNRIAENLTCKAFKKHFAPELQLT